jgi:hypothetical protein
VNKERQQELTQEEALLQHMTTVRPQLIMMMEVEAGKVQMAHLLLMMQMEVEAILVQMAPLVLMMQMVVDPILMQMVPLVLILQMDQVLTPKPMVVLLVWMPRATEAMKVQMAHPVL